jgi:uncharacterized membrane protein YkvI
MHQVNRFCRYVLPGLAFKAVVIGGGYATGREIATFFLPSGAIGGLYGLLVSTAVWSVICAVTFSFALETRTADYRSFFQALLGPFWRIYEIAYFLALVVLLAVFAAAAGAIVHAVLGWPPIIGTVLLMSLIVLFAAYGNDSVERLFKYVSFLLYGTYALFVVLSFVNFGDRIANAFTTGTVTGHWASEGMTYSGYNIIGAIVILPVTRHLMGRKDALIAGLIAGPLAALPAILFFICMTGYATALREEVLPSDFLLEHLHFPAFRILFQAMVFAALLESGTGGVHAINQRIAHAYQTNRGRELSRSLRVGITIALLFVAVFVAGEFGLVALIANGYRWLAYTLILIYVLPIMTLGVWRIFFRHRCADDDRASLSPD